MSSSSLRILGIDPGLRRTGWGVITQDAARYRFAGCGAVTPDAALPLSQRLCLLVEGIEEVLREFTPDAVAIEEIFLNTNPHSTLKLGMARGVVLMLPARFGLSVTEYRPNLVKKTVVGVGHAEKHQVQKMIRLLVTGCPQDLSPDAADALAVAVCHGQHARVPYKGGSQIWRESAKAPESQRWPILTKVDSE